MVTSAASSSSFAYSFFLLHPDLSFLYPAPPVSLAMISEFRVMQRHPGGACSALLTPWFLMMRTLPL